ncbi:SEC-C domain-containing protein [uncultured Draconibacterium sp.]|uniref:SEC-C domain-containing protein n=1 Tax=uncultured Draconibacterium sp. TaxID=1573823 RepID=UPI0029C884F4|nr:SEC-C domain-containing protein [uncultured Draconibacterium sp.]
MEILADLKKDFDNSKNANKRVQDFAKKLLPYNSAVNIFYMELFAGDLIYGNTTIDYTPVLGSSELVKSDSGKIGFHFKESPQEKAISRWRDGEFLIAEKELASIWRTNTTQKDLLVNLKETLKDKIKIKESFKNLEDLNQHVNLFLENPVIQEELLIFLISEFGVSAENASLIFFRWAQAENKSVKVFAPYAFFCGKVKILFDLALRFDLVGTRPTNLLDLQYLYYLPFAKLFTSNDKFQKSLAPFLMDSNQEFIDGMELKNDLKNLANYRSTLYEKKDILRTQNEPPQIPDSLTYKIWNKYFDWPPKYKSLISKTPDNYKETMDEFINAKKTNADPGKNIKGDVEFLVREHFMKPTDICFCGSGKMFKDCCLPKDYFEKMKKHGG